MPKANHHSIAKPGRRGVITAALAAVETEIADRYAAIAKLSGDPPDAEQEAIYRLDDQIARTKPRSLTECAVKLRRLLDRTTGIDSGRGKHDVLSLAQILAFIHQQIGEPTHRTRPTSRKDYDFISYRGAA